jgi:hypothetical protein
MMKCWILSAMSENSLPLEGLFYGIIKQDSFLEPASKAQRNAQLTYQVDSKTDELSLTMANTSEQKSATYAPPARSKKAERG